MCAWSHTLLQRASSLSASQQQKQKNIHPIKLFSCRRKCLDRLDSQSRSRLTCSFAVERTAASDNTKEKEDGKNVLSTFLFS